ncbi:late secretory pathway protein avl9 [Scheffersomyces spartinae]|uniref:Late secretory pathway protein avl9 n=1 Tax=Scheffersomyces spartinae TaxID=45513 RepID=A0A9P7V910_9ASCO|nr:late secretory pathway protein avl9 [Scheffersomyces spartinae]KAG7193601.1 late secretory pathway protein avl9 [Scheffersomyces spartinae]
MESDDEFRPIRLAKRDSHGGGSSAASSEIGGSGSQTFHMKPIRLGSRNRRSFGLVRASSFSSSGASPPLTPKFKSHDPIFALCCVDFHHQRGPEIQWWKSNYHPEYTPNLFKNLPFQALPDGSHLYDETFSNFILVYDTQKLTSLDDHDDELHYSGDPRQLMTLFGCSCVGTIKTSEMDPDERAKNKDITRSLVQKAVVVIAKDRPIFTHIKEKLSIITKSYFLQKDLANFKVFEDLFEDLNIQYTPKEDVPLPRSPGVLINKEEDDEFVNLNLKDYISRFKANFLLIFKMMLLEKRILVFSGSNLAQVFQFQNNLISLIPGLLSNLQESGSTLIDFMELTTNLGKPTSINTLSRHSMLRFFGLPLKLFDTKGAMWAPYLPLQQLDNLKCESFLVGTSNLLIFNQARQLQVDVLINLDTDEVTFPSGKSEEFNLLNMDKKFINHLLYASNSSNSDSSDFVGNDDYLRLKFEDYLLSLLLTLRLRQYGENFNGVPPGFEINNEMGNLSLFNQRFVDLWKETKNCKIWNLIADEFIFNFITPHHYGIECSKSGSSNFKLPNWFLKRQAGASTTSKSDPEHKARKFIEASDTASTTTSETAASSSINANTNESSFESILGLSNATDQSNPKGWSWPTFKWKA